MSSAGSATRDDDGSKGVVSFLRLIKAPEKGVSNWYRSVKISPDGSTIATAGENHLVRIWDPSTAASIATLRGHTDWVLCLAYAPNGLILTSGSYDGTIRVWDTTTWTNVGEPLKSDGGPVRDIAFCPDGSQFISSSSTSIGITVWSTENFSQVGEPIKGHDRPVTTVDFSLDGSFFASGCAGGSIILWDASTRTMLGKPLLGHTNEVHRVLFSQDGSRIASASEDHTVRLWDTSSGNPLAVFEGHSEAVRSLVFIPSTSILVSGSVDTTLRLWHIDKKMAIGDPVKDHTSTVTGVDCSRDGQLLVSSSVDCTVRMWHFNRNVFPRPYLVDVPSNAGTLPFGALYRDGIVSASVPNAPGLFRGHANWVNAVAFSPDGATVASGADDRTVRIWTTDGDHSELHCLETNGQKARVQCVAFSPDGKTLASASNAVWLWDTTTGKSTGRLMWSQADIIYAVVFSHDGLRVLAGGNDATVRVWDPAAGEVVGKTYERHKGTVYSLDITAAGLVASASADETVHLWDTDPLAVARAPLKGHSGEVRAAKFTPDGKVLASASEDWTMRLWDVESGTTIVILKGHTSVVRSIAFSPEGRILASCSVDETVRLWDTKQGTAIGAPLRHPPGTQMMTFAALDISADGRKMAAGSWNKIVYLWDIQISVEHQRPSRLEQCEFDTDTGISHTISVEEVMNTPSSALYPSPLPVHLGDSSTAGQSLSPPDTQPSTASVATTATEPRSIDDIIRSPQPIPQESAQDLLLSVPARSVSISRRASPDPLGGSASTVTPVATPLETVARLSVDRVPERSRPASRGIVPSAGDSSSQVVIREDRARGQQEQDRSPLTIWWNNFSMRNRRESLSPAASTVMRSPDQSERFVETRRRVVRAANSVLGTTVDLAHDALASGVDLLNLAPVPGLASAGHILLDIWNAFQKVQTNRSACQELTKRCADLLISVREEIVDAGQDVSEELRAPIDKLHETFQEVLLLMMKQVELPFLRRYLGRDKILTEINDCDASLKRALDMFSLSVQIRTLKLMQSGLKSNFRIIGNRRESLSRNRVAAELQTIRDQQNEQDRIQDLTHLRQLLRAAVQTNDDLTMVEILQIGRDEMPDAMNALERTLQNSVLSSTEDDRLPQDERRRDRLLARIGLRRESERNTPSPAPSTESIDREFVQSGVEALRRLTLRQGDVPELPSWTITRFEIDIERSIGIGSFSTVYRGTWRNRTVAIKMLADATPKNLFVKEAELWKTFSHPNIVPLLGASSASSNPPWFFVSPYYKHGNLVKFLKDLPVVHEAIILRCMQEIAVGMVYLHEHDILHGDLKAVNVLVDDNMGCVITDFGQSEMRSEVFRLSRQPVTRGTLRWQAPELMRGASVMTREIDVYAYAITCVEILSKGGLPWPLQDDEAVRHLVLVKNQAPPIVWDNVALSGPLSEILAACWNADPTQRPSFGQALENLRQLRLR
ncbi:WD40 repeat-like protein [Dentipellis sp. KUC8613]|nr:WD40 repeat-like protein [Dentipellis sp. KUC8613]